MAKKEKNTELVRKEESHPVSPFEDMERYFDKFFKHPFSLMTRPSWSGFDFPAMEEMSPSVDIYEEKGKMIVKAEIPGINKEDLDVSITENTVTISGEKKQEKKVEKKDYHREERRYGSFCRRFRLPADVDADKAEASFKNGVLEISLPKTKESKQKKVTIS
ncbi:Hsp20/alpha crystallin family protein [Desulfogranum marinum]|uniref:Hsp20/alpha crystallin family protein n=1 Tax=Desulfogranum marinum TaxID=453220 RepID=UPI0029C6EE7A|nr:Hsp20/alpha crystallin family protein [Desulfogranum marinum]